MRFQASDWRIVPLQQLFLQAGGMMWTNTLSGTVQYEPRIMALNGAPSIVSPLIPCVTDRSLSTVMEVAEP